MPELDLSRIAITFEQHVAAASAGDLDLARRTLRRLPPERWALEWCLPGWLAGTFRLDPGVAMEIAVGTVLGLVSVRLQDDLLDHDLPSDEIAAARRLSAVLFDEAVAVYGRHLSPGSPFWPFLERSMIDWRAASECSGPAGADRLAARGAPLKVPAMAVCLLADRLDCWPLVDRCLERALTALVRYDQFHDWEDDLVGDRWNAFVAAVSPHRQGPGERDRNRSTVLAALLTRGIAQAEFESIQQEASEAARLAEELGCAPLAAFLRDYARRTAQQGEVIEQHYQQAAGRAVELIFGPVHAGS